VLHAACGGQWKQSTARNARGKRHPVKWLWQPASATAWIETAGVVGLAELSTAERDPLTASSAGVGELIASAMREGAEKIMICLGGIATNDAGCGMAGALGFRFLDGHGRDIEPAPASLLRLKTIKAPPTDKQIKVIALTDVRNPLLGPEGASSVYGPQKGAAPCDIEILENALRHIVDIARRDIMAPDPMLAGAGAAGGLGYGVMAFLGGRLLEGSERIGELTGLPAAVRASDLIVTGEGRFDAQTAAGKAPAHLARMAREQGKPVIAIVGSMADEADNGIFDAAFPLVREPYDLATALRDAAHLLEKTAAEAARSVKQGKVC
jgi:glycerate kinase